MGPWIAARENLVDGVLQPRSATTSMASCNFIKGAPLRPVAQRIPQRRQNLVTSCSATWRLVRDGEEICTRDPLSGSVLCEKLEVVQPSSRDEEPRKQMAVRKQFPNEGEEICTRDVVSGAVSCKPAGSPEIAQGARPSVEMPMPTATFDELLGYIVALKVQRLDLLEGEQSVIVSILGQGHRLVQLPPGGVEQVEATLAKAVRLGRVMRSSQASGRWWPDHRPRHAPETRVIGSDSTGASSSNISGHANAGPGGFGQLLAAGGRSGKIPSMVTRQYSMPAYRVVRRWTAPPVLPGATSTAPALQAHADTDAVQGRSQASALRLGMTRSTATSSNDGNKHAPSRHAAHTHAAWRGSGSSGHLRGFAGASASSTSAAMALSGTVGVPSGLGVGAVPPYGAPTPILWSAGLIVPLSAAWVLLSRRFSQLRQAMNAPGGAASASSNSSGSKGAGSADPFRGLHRAWLGRDGDGEGADVSGRARGRAAGAGARAGNASSAGVASRPLVGSDVDYDSDGGERTPSGGYDVGRESFTSGVARFFGKGRLRYRGPPSGALDYTSDAAPATHAPTASPQPQGTGSGAGHAQAASNAADASAPPQSPAASATVASSTRERLRRVRGKKAGGAADPSSVTQGAPPSTSSSSPPLPSSSSLKPSSAGASARPQAQPGSPRMPAEPVMPAAGTRAAAHARLLPSSPSSATSAGSASTAGAASSATTTTLTLSAVTRRMAELSERASATPSLKLLQPVPLAPGTSAPLLVYLPGLDGTGQGVRRQVAPLVGRSGYDLRCLHIPNENEGGWADMAAALLPRVREAAAPWEARLRAAASASAAATPGGQDGGINKGTGDGVGVGPLPTVTLLAESFTAPLALMLARAAPDLIARVILVNPATGLASHGRLPLLLEAVTDAGVLTTGVLPGPLVDAVLDAIQPLLLLRRGRVNASPQELAFTSAIPQATLGRRLGMLQEAARWISGVASNAGGHGNGMASPLDSISLSSGGLSAAYPPSNGVASRGASGGGVIRGGRRDGRGENVPGGADILPDGGATGPLEGPGGKEFLRGVRQPVLILAGAKDRLQPSLEEAGLLAALLPDGTRVALPESGHSALLEMGVDVGEVMEQAGWRTPEVTAECAVAMTAHLRAGRPAGVGARLGAAKGVRRGGKEGEGSVGADATGSTAARRPLPVHTPVAPASMNSLSRTMGPADALVDEGMEALGRLLEPWKLLASPLVTGEVHLPHVAARGQGQARGGRRGGADAQRPILFVGNHTPFGVFDVPIVAHELYVRGIRCQGMVDALNLVGGTHNSHNHGGNHSNGHGRHGGHSNASTQGWGPTATSLGGAAAGTALSLLTSRFGIVSADLDEAYAMLRAGRSVLLAPAQASRAPGGGASSPGSSASSASTSSRHRSSAGASTANRGLRDDWGEGECDYDDGYHQHRRASGSQGGPSGSAGGGRSGFDRASARGARGDSSRMGGGRYRSTNDNDYDNDFNSSNTGSRYGAGASAAGGRFPSQAGQEGAGYRVTWPAGDDWLEVARAADAIVVPFSTLGGDEMFEVDKGGVVGRLLASPLSAVMKPLLSALPLPPAPDGALPLPNLSRMYIHFGEPIDTRVSSTRPSAAPAGSSARSQQAAADQLAWLAAQVREAVEDGVGQLTRARESDPHRDVGTRLLAELSLMMPHFRQ
eukprot:jgi/Mesvir1/3481/Mv11972-RA.1